jgi:hypothetical protein
MDWTTGAQIPQAQRKASQQHFLETFERLQLTVRQMEGDRENFLRRISDMERSLGLLETKVGAAPEVDTSQFATKAEVQQLRKEIQDLNAEWSRKNEEIKNQIEKSFENLEVQLRALAVAPSPGAGSSTTGGASAAQSESGSPVAPEGHTLYQLEIKSGDSYSSLVRYINNEYNVNISVDDLVKANPNVNPRRMAIGQTIFFPLPNGVKP